MKLVNIVSKIINCLLVIIIAIIIGLLIFPKVLGYTPYTILTGSMEPTYHVGSIIYVKEVPFQELKVDDPITFKSSSVIITHRIVEIDKENQEVITKGDANNSLDGTTSYGDIIGKASKITIPYLGYLSAFISTTKGKIILLIILGGISLFSYLIKSIFNER